MMEWKDTGIVLSVRPHGETSAIVAILTKDRGRHLGYVRGARSKKYQGVLDAGNEVSVKWFSRLEDNLGGFDVEQETSYAGQNMDDPVKLSAIQSACAIADACLPERETHLSVYEGMKVFLDSLDGPVWVETYVFWELALLKELGFGLDLRHCAGGGDNDQLAYVSPKTGRAVSLSMGEPYKDKLLPLSPFLLGRAGDDPKEVMDALSLSEYFLRNRVFYSMNKDIPESRARFVDRLAKQAETSPAAVATML